jgi:hypothetical protein
MLPRTHIERATRRSFVSRSASGIAAFGLFGGVPRAAEAQLVWKASQWKLGEFQKLVNEPARVKQVFDVVQIADGEALNSVKNSLNGLRFGFGIPEHQIKIVAALHGAANLLNYDDYVWDKYQIGEWLNVTDPAPGKTCSEERLLQQQRWAKEGVCLQRCRRSGFYLSGQEHASLASEGRAVSELPYRPGRTGAGPHSAPQPAAIA